MDSKQDRFYHPDRFLYVPYCWDKSVKKPHKGHEWIWYEPGIKIPVRKILKASCFHFAAYMLAFCLSAVAVALFR